MRNTKRTVILTLMLILLTLPRMALGAQLPVSTPAPPGTFPYPGPAYSPVAMVIGMLSLTIGFAVGITRIITNDIMVKLRQRKERAKHLDEGGE